MNLIDHSRALICINGDDAATFLQGIITQDIVAADEKPIFSAMLSPQGKWLFDFFIMKQRDGYWLDVRRVSADALMKKLTLYKLRANVNITKLDGWTLSYLSPATHHSSPFTFFDPRHPSLPTRIWRESETAPENVLSLEHVLIERLHHAIPEGGIDATENETLLDLGYDLLNAVSFTKGCYIGQEVTARMHYKSISRKGFYHVQASQALPQESGEITCDGKTIAQLRSRHLNQGIAFARFEDVGEQKEAKIQGISVVLSIPEWLRPRYELHLRNRET